MAKGDHDNHGLGSVTENYIEFDTRVCNTRVKVATKSIMKFELRLNWLWKNYAPSYVSDTQVLVSTQTSSLVNKCSRWWSTPLPIEIVSWIFPNSILMRLR